MNPNDEFYIGWESKSPQGIGSWMRRIVLLLLLLSAGLGLAMVAAQRSIGVSVFEWGTIKDFSGILQIKPYPHLLVLRPGSARQPADFSSYYLVKPFKFGLDPELVNRLDGQTVSLRGTLIYRGNQTMIEALPDSIKLIEHRDARLASAAVAQPVSLGRRTLVGEIVDSKCYLGVMNPGQLTPHRACAIRCISGGCPPVLLVRQTNGAALYLLLVAGDGRPVNKRVLDMVAEPLQITGEVVRQGSLLILRADPATYRRWPL